jgi:hypothetical protein
VSSMTETTLPAGSQVFALQSPAVCVAALLPGGTFAVVHWLWAHDAATHSPVAAGQSLVLVQPQVPLPTQSGVEPTHGFAIAVCPVTSQDADVFSSMQNIVDAAQAAHAPLATSQSPGLQVATLVQVVRSFAQRWRTSP